MSREKLRQRLERLENDRFITADGVEAVFITVADNSKEGAGKPLPTRGWMFQRHGGADDVVTMREPGEDDDSLRERHLAAVRPLLPQGSVPMFLPINPE
ncbi:hypothetical protein [Halomonas urumqiensis]|uniref:Uncharacterized protein n=1 Tax=Halomonas urumqiensis TaxID=1684789 RepID=A0A2N7UF87_9GAMM|nr:hypothetical protein [Halomonas urumqiensis]PMR79097.1 hypothetical protein C1H70_12375 [Halomonas urumqiensis]PTB03771.1 hypothetical protein C6V82_04660 [Halomonas urumqiensis]GHE20002.1 hypothetical protein GCM10017767_05230 [Halomonas urumqiensis]